MNRLNLPRLRFACKLTFAVVSALLLGFHLQLETPRWSVLTAALVAAGPAFAAGGEPFAGAIRQRGWLRIIGTFIGCIGGLAIIILTIRAPVLMLLLCCLWAGICTWISSLVRVENSYAFGLAGYTTLIIIVSVSENPLVTPQFAVERCSEIVLGILCAILADILFSPRSIKREVDRQVDALLVEQYRLMQQCLTMAGKEEIDRAWNALVKNTTLLDSMRSSLMMESSRWQRSNRRLRAMKTLSLTLITHACESYLFGVNHPDMFTDRLKQLFGAPVESAADVHQRLKLFRHLIATSRGDQIPQSVSTWVGAATRYLLLAKGIHTNGKISRVEEEILRDEVVIKPASAERHHAMINGLRTSIATALGCLFWLWTGWTSGSVCMVMIAVVTSLVMRLPNPKMVAFDFLLGTMVALPVGALYFLVILPATQQSMLLLCISLGLLAFIIGIEVQKRRLGSLGTLASTINIIVLSNPMVFDVRLFLDSAIGQVIGCSVAMAVILLVRDSSKERIGRTLLNRFVYAALSVLTTQKSRRQENHLPALYQQLYQLLMLFPTDIAKYRLALTLIIAHQRLRQAEIPENEVLSTFHRQIRATADRVIATGSDVKRCIHFERLLDELYEYQCLLVTYQAPVGVVASVQRLSDVLHKYRHALID